MKKLLFPFLLTLCSAPIWAQTPTLAWQKALGGTMFDAAYSVLPTADSGYLVASLVESNDGDVVGNQGQYDVWLVKLSSTGGIVWKKTIGGSLSEQPTDIIQTADGGYMMSGYTKSVNGDVSFSHGGNDAWLVKLSASGAIQWEKTYGGTLHEAALSVKQTTDGGYIMVGWSGSNDGDLDTNQGNEDAWIVKLTDTGGITWKKSIGGSDEDHFTCVEQTADGGYIVSGTVKSLDKDIVGNHGGEEIIVAKFTSGGAVTWQYCYGGTGDDLNGDHSYKGSIHQTFDGGYIFCAGTKSSDGDITTNHGDSDYWLVKLTSAGAISWQKTFGGTLEDQATALHQTVDSGYVVAGLAKSADGDVIGNHGSYDAWVLKLTKTGAITWQRACGSIGKDLAFDLRRTFDGNYIIAGYAAENTGDVTGVHGNNYDAWIAALKVVNGVDDVSFDRTTVRLYPNPASKEISVSGIDKPGIEIYNSLGQLVLKTSGESHISIADLPKGVYNISISANDGTVVKTEKLLKL
jgi:hypothetical protein